jgi:hypothetical protein
MTRLLFVFQEASSLRNSKSQKIRLFSRSLRLLRFVKAESSQDLSTKCTSLNLIPCILLFPIPFLNPNRKLRTIQKYVNKTTAFNITTELSLFLSSSFLFIGIMDIEVSEVVRVLISGDDTKPITEIVLLEVLLCKVLQIPLGERGLGRNCELSLLAGNADLVSQDSGLAIDLHTIVEELLEDGRVKETVINRGGEVQSELQSLGLLSARLAGSLGLGLGGLRLDSASGRGSSSWGRSSLGFRHCQREERGRKKVGSTPRR